MKKILSFLLAALLIVCIVPSAFAADTSREYMFELSVDGADTKQVQTGDIITVVFTLRRTDSAEAADMYAMQNEIRYDSNFFELVEGSELLSSGISTTDIGLRDSYRELYMNYLSLAGGESWESEKMIGSFRLKVIAESGVSKITNQDYFVSTADGTDSYVSACQDVTVILSTECTVSFESNGGSKVESKIAYYGETVEKPDDPERIGYSFVGWYSDIDLKKAWNFESDTVQGNMTLYAKWQKNAPNVSDDTSDVDDTTPTNPTSDGEGQRRGTILLIMGAVLLICLIAAVLVMVINRKTVKFVTDCNQNVPEQKVKRGGYIERPAEPKREGRMFAGWYTDEQRTRRWDFEENTVRDNMTLYAKWI